MFEPIDSILEKYDISVNGFLPAELPLAVLPDEYYQPWERVIGRLPALLLAKRLRTEVHQMPVLSPSRLVSSRELKRAYGILAFLTHAYIWEGDVPSDRLAPSVSVPFLKVAAQLGLPASATYAATNLWNYSILMPDANLECPEDLTVLHTFTGSKDEAWFYLVSIAMEAQNAHIIPEMLHAFQAASKDDVSTVIASLRALKTCINDTGVLLERMHENCDPHIFYHHIRPFLAGSKNMGAAGLPSGVFYDDGAGNRQWRQYSGGSNAQSSLIQFLDITLGIQHHPEGATTGCATFEKENSFLKDMRSYMPGPHGRFLDYVASIANIRSYVENRPKNTELRD